MPITIALVADPEEPRLERFAQDMPVWAIASPSNRHIGELYAEPEWDGARRIAGVSLVEMPHRSERPPPLADIVGALLARAQRETAFATVEHILVSGVRHDEPGVRPMFSELGFHELIVFTKSDEVPRSFTARRVV